MSVCDYRLVASRLDLSAVRPSSGMTSLISSKDGHDGLSLSKIVPGSRLTGITVCPLTLMPKVSSSSCLLVRLLMASLITPSQVFRPRIWTSAFLLRAESSRLSAWRISNQAIQFLSWKSSLSKSLESSSNADEALDASSYSKKRVVFLGTPDVAATTLKTLHEASSAPDAIFDMVGVVTQPPKRRKRKGKEEASPVGKMAEEIGLPILCPESAKDPTFLDELEQQWRPDLCITAAYGQYLPKRFLAIPSCGTVNIHPSLLPKWRGASPVQRSLQAGDNPVGVSILFTVSKMDAGPIIAQVTREIDENDTASTVLPLLFQVGTDCLLQRLPAILSGEITMDKNVILQDETQVVQAAMIDSSEAEFRVWEETARQCHNRLRGFSIWPQAYMWFQVGDREPIKVKILKTRLVNRTIPPTDLVQLGPTKQDGLYVACADGSILELLEVQPATKKAFPARDFQNGYPGEAIRWIKTPTQIGNEDQLDE